MSIFSRHVQNSFFRRYWISRVDIGRWPRPAAWDGSHQWCLTLTRNITKTTDWRITCHCFLRPIRRDLTSSSYTTWYFGYLVNDDVVNAKNWRQLQDISGEHLNRGSNKAQDRRLDIRARGFWKRHRSAFFDVRVCHPNAVSYRDLEPQQIYRIHENEKKRLYSKRVLDIEHGTFTPLVFTTTGGMGKECLMYHSRLAQLIAIKKGEQYAKTISWIRTRTSFALLRSALVCLRGSRTRRVPCDIKNVDIDVEVVEGAIQSD